MANLLHSSKADASSDKDVITNTVYEQGLRTASVYVGGEY